ASDGYSIVMPTPWSIRSSIEYAGDPGWETSPRHRPFIALGSVVLTGGRPVSALSEGLHILLFGGPFRLLVHHKLVANCREEYTHRAIDTCANSARVQRWRHVLSKDRSPQLSRNHGGQFLTYF